MNKKYLLTVGCSFFHRSWDDELAGKPSQRKLAREDLSLSELIQNRLSTMLAYKLNRIDVNLSRSGTNNNYIFKTVMDYVITHKEKDLHIIVGITDPSRTQLYSSVDTKALMHIVGGKLIETDKNKFSKLFPDVTLEDMNTTIDRYYGHMYSQELQESRLIYDIIMLHTFCKFYNKNITFIPSIIPENHIKSYPYNKLLLKLKKHPEIDFFNFNIQDRIFSWRHFISTYDLDYKGSHPILADNEKLAELLYNHINETYST